MWGRRSQKEMQPEEKLKRRIISNCLSHINTASQVVSRVNGLSRLGGKDLGSNSVIAYGLQIMRSLFSGLQRKLVACQQAILSFK